MTSSGGTATFTLAKDLPLPLTGGRGTFMYMAANQGFLFVSTSFSQAAVEIQKSNLDVEQVAASAPSSISSITADSYGYVTVDFGRAASESG